MDLLWVLVAIILILWLLGFVVFPVGGSLIHVLLVLVIVIILIRLLRGQSI